MKNRMKIICNAEDNKIAFLILNDKYEWVSVPSTSKLSREEFTSIPLENNAKKVLDYISSVYGTRGDKIEIILEGFSEECVMFNNEALNYGNIKVRTRENNILFCGKTGSGKSTLIKALSKMESLEEAEHWQSCRVNKTTWYEISGLGIEKGSYKKVISDIDALIEYANISVVVYCAQFSGRRLEEAEMDLLNYIKEKIPDVRIIIAVTKCIDAVGAKEFEFDLDNLIVVPVRAEKVETRLGTVEPFGLHKISNFIFEGM